MENSEKKPLLVAIPLTRSITSAFLFTTDSANAKLPAVVFIPREGWVAILSYWDILQHGEISLRRDQLIRRAWTDAL
jgi:hypothetical protein